jgi:hypothetical protein
MADRLNNLNRGHWIDAAWKKVLSDGADDAIDFFLPELSRDRDKSKEIELAGGELQGIGADSDIRARIADVCFSVPLITGKSCKAGCVVEQQHDDDKDFAGKIFRGFYRLSDRLNDDVTALAIFTGNARDRNEYKYSYYGVNLSFGYNTYHVMSQNIERLKQDGRVFAPVVLAARMMMEAKGEPQSREKYARELLKIMRERDYDNAKKRNVLSFIGHILRLQDKDINSELRGEFMMQFIPLSEYRKLSAIEDAKELGEMVSKMDAKELGKIVGNMEGKMEVARSMISEGLSLEIIKKCTGLMRMTYSRSTIFEGISSRFILQTPKHPWMSLWMARLMRLLYVGLLFLRRIICGGIGNARRANT